MRITLQGGLTVEYVALKLLWKMEGLRVAVTVEDGAVILRPQGRVPAEDIPVLRRHKDDLRRLVEYRVEAPR